MQKPSKAELQKTVAALTVHLATINAAMQIVLSQRNNLLIAAADKEANAALLGVTKPPAPEKPTP